jgi:hypothetical protein
MKKAFQDFTTNDRSIQNRGDVKNLTNTPKDSGKTKHYPSYSLRRPGSRNELRLKMGTNSAVLLSGTARANGLFFDIEPHGGSSECFR